MIKQKDTCESLIRTSNQRQRLKENDNKSNAYVQNQEETVEIAGQKLRKYGLENITHT